MRGSDLVGKTILIIGLGNPLREDDGIGTGIIEMLAETLSPVMREKVSLTVAHQVDLVLAERITGYNSVIFVDAMASCSGPPVAVKKIEPSCEPPAFSSHIGSIPLLLAITSGVYGATPGCYLVAVEGSNFSFGRKLSAKSKNNAALGVQTIINLISELLPPD